MNISVYRIFIITTVLLIFFAAIMLFFFRPTPSDEEIPRGSKRVEINLHENYIFHS